MKLRINQLKPHLPRAHREVGLDGPKNDCLGASQSPERRGLRSSGFVGGRRPAFGPDGPISEAVSERLRRPTASGKHRNQCVFAKTHLPSSYHEHAEDCRAVHRDFSHCVPRPRVWPGPGLRRRVAGGSENPHAGRGRTRREPVPAEGGRDVPRRSSPARPTAKASRKAAWARPWASRGYVFVSQDCRGKGTSGGQWVPFVHDRDGRRGHPPLDPRAALVQRQDRHHRRLLPRLHAMDLGARRGRLPARRCSPSCRWWTSYDDLVYVGGAYQLQVVMGWGSGTAGSVATRTLEARGLAARAAAVAPGTRRSARRCRSCATGSPIRSSTTTGSRSSLRGRHEDITTPDLHRLRLVRPLREERVRPRERRPERLALASRPANTSTCWSGPWPHGINRDRKVGDVDFGEGSLVKLDEIQAKWFNHWLKGEEQRRRDTGRRSGSS